MDRYIGYTAHRRIIRENRTKLERLLPADGLSEVRAHCDRPKKAVGSARLIRQTAFTILERANAFANWKYR